MHELRPAIVEAFDRGYYRVREVDNPNGIHFLRPSEVRNDTGHVPLGTKGTLKYEQVRNAAYEFFYPSEA